MVQTGINKLPPRSVTFFARRESKDPSPTDIFGPDNKKFRVILDYGKDFMRSADRTTADAKKLKQALGLDDSQWYETTLQIFRGSAEINCKSILANEFASDKNNRTEAKYDEFLCDILTKTYGVPYLGDCMVNFIWRGNIKMEQGPEGPYIELNTFRASFTVYWSVATGPYTKRRHTYDHNKMMECIFACLPRRYQAAIDSSPTVDIYNENKEEEMWTLLDGEREKDIANGVLERIHKQQQQQKAAAAAERKAQAAKAKKRAEEKARGDRGRQGFRRPRHHANNSFPSKNGKHSNQHYGPSKRDNNYKPPRPEKSHDDRAPRKDDRNNNRRRDYSKSSAYHNADDSVDDSSYDDRRHDDRHEERYDDDHHERDDDRSRESEHSDDNYAAEYDSRRDRSYRYDDYRRSPDRRKRSRSPERRRKSERRRSRSPEKKQRKSRWGDSPSVNKNDTRSRSNAYDHYAADLYART